MMRVTLIFVYFWNTQRRVPFSFSLTLSVFLCFFICHAWEIKLSMLSHLIVFFTVLIYCTVFNFSVLPFQRCPSSPTYGLSASCCCWTSSSLSLRTYQTNSVPRWALTFRMTPWARLFFSSLYSPTSSHSLVPSTQSLFCMYIPLLFMLYEIILITVWFSQKKLS